VFFSSVWSVKSDFILDNQHIDVDPNFLCDVPFVLNCFNKMSARVSTGADGFPSILFKSCGLALAAPVCLLINRCIRERFIPSDWKVAIVTPVNKIPSPLLVSDYRPISVLSVVSKVFERHLKTVLLPFIEPFLHESQFGFRSQRSTSDALMSFDTKVNFYLNDCKEVVCVFFDVSKAFDRVPHCGLLSVLRDKFNIPTPILALLRCYLQDRKQSVRVGGVLSQSAVVTSGVVQGSVLGPLLYIAYTNSLGSLAFTGKSTIVQYADDLVLMCPLINATSMNDVQSNVNLIVDHLKSLDLDVNATKTQSQVFSRSGKSAVVPFINVRNAPVALSTDTKYLGVTLDSKLDYGTHTAKKVVTVKRAIGYISRVFRKSVSIRSLLLLYVSLFRSVLLYACEVTYPGFKKDRLKLERCQKFAFKCFFRDHKSVYSVLLGKAMLKPLYDFAFRFKMCLIHKYVCNISLFPMLKFSASFNTRTTSRNRHCHDIHVPFSNLTRFYSSSYVLICKAYNSLPYTLVALSLKSFKNYLKLHSSEVLAEVLKKCLSDEKIVDLCVEL